MDTTIIEKRLTDTGKAHRRAKVRMAAAKDDLYDAIMAGKDAGLSLGVMADLAGVSKPLVGQVVEKGGKA